MLHAAYAGINRKTKNEFLEMHDILLENQEHLEDKTYNNIIRPISRH